MSIFHPESPVSSVAPAFLTPLNIFHSTHTSRPVNLTFRRRRSSHSTTFPMASVVPRPPSPPVPPLQPTLSLPAPPSPKHANMPSRWAVAISAATIHALHAAAIYIAPSTLLAPMRHSLSLSVAQITRPLLLYRVVQALFLFPAGLLLDIAGPTRLLRLSILAAALSAPLLSVVTSLSQLTVLQIFFSLTKLTGGLSAMILVMTSYFPPNDHLATATGILLAGYSFAGFLAPALIGILDRYFGWRIASFILSLLFSVIAVPLTFLFLREPPAVAATRPTLRQAFSIALVRIRSRLQPRQNSPPVSSPEPLLSKPYLFVMAAVGAFSFSLHIIFDHLLLFLKEDVAMPFDTATLYLSALNLVALFTKLAIGPLADRVNKSLLVVAFSVVTAFASLLLLDFSAISIVTTVNTTKIFLFVVLYAIGYAASFSLLTAVLPEFGTKQLGTRSNCNLLVNFGTASAGSYVAAKLRSSTGNYKLAFLYSAASWIIVAGAGLAKYLWFDRPSRLEQKTALDTSGASSKGGPLKSKGSM